MTPSNPPTGMRTFTIIWAGQIVSMLGSAMTWFAFTIWAWQKTGQASALATISFFVFLPTALFTPVAGALIDRWNRKLVMMLSDLATALGTLVALILFVSGRLEIWHVYGIGILMGFFTAFQYPAYSAAVSTILPKEHYARAEAMLGLAYAVSSFFAPIAAAALLGMIGMPGIMIIDLITFLAAFGTLLWAHIPQPPMSDQGRQSRGKLWQEALFGFRYIRERSSLSALIILFSLAYFFIAIGAALLAPLVLSHTGNSTSTLALVQSVGALGGIIGGGLLTVWGGPKRRIWGVLFSGIGVCILGIISLGLATTVIFWAIGSFFFSFFEPFIEGGHLAIWQSKVEADVQGRVFSARQLLTQIPYLLGTLASGFLAEYVVQPITQSQPALQAFFGKNSGAGISMLVILAGLGGAVVFLVGCRIPAIRDVETSLPDRNPNMSEIGIVRD
jgi:MFS family permease